MLIIKIAAALFLIVAFCAAILSSVMIYRGINIWANIYYICGDLVLMAFFAAVIGHEILFELYRQRFGN